MYDKEKKELKAIYELRKPDIERRLNEFAEIWRSGTEEELFAELAFCIFTPQSRARMCDQAVKELSARGLLGEGGFSEVRPYLKGVRFPNNKTRFFIAARDKLLSGGEFNIRRHVEPRDVQTTRDWFVSNIKGLGYKEASHFLRNIGQGQSLAILDVHILRNMCRLGLSSSVSGGFSRNKYLQTESVLARFCEDTGIPLAHMDLLLWSRETGEIFK